MRRVDPGGANDERVARLQRGELAVTLGAAVDRRWASRVAGLVRARGFAVEDIVGRHVDETRAPRVTRRAEIGDGAVVHAIGDVGLGFGEIHRGVGGRVEDHVGAHVGKDRVDPRAVANVERVDAERDDFCVKRRPTHELGCELPPCASDEDALHANASAAANAMAFVRSFSLSWTLAAPPISASGHSIASAGSFHAIARSCSGA